MKRPLLTVIPYCGRLNYLRLLLATIREADAVDGVRLLLYRTRRDLEIPARLLQGLDAKVVEFDLGEERNWLVHHAVWLDVFDIHRGHDVILNFDSDAIVHPWVFRKARAMLERFPDLGLGTLFNQESDPDLDCGDPLFVEKRSLGFLAALVTRKVVDLVRREPQEDRGFAAACLRKGWKIVASRTSFAEHMGWEGLNSPDWTHELPASDRWPDGRIRIARARRFMSEFQ